MLRICSFILLSCLSVSYSQAGLFEYTLGESTHINASSGESADAVETLDYNKNQIHSTSYVHRYHFSEDTVSGVESEMKHLLDIASQMRIDISKMKNYSSRPYVVLRSQLQKDLRDVQDRINYLSDRKRDLIQSTNYYSYRTNNSRFRSARAENYYKKYNYTYNDYNYGYYTYDYNNNYYTRQPHWVNPNLRQRSQ